MRDNHGWSRLHAVAVAISQTARCCPTCAGTGRISVPDNYSGRCSTCMGVGHTMHAGEHARELQDALAHLGPGAGPKPKRPVRKALRARRRKGG